MASQPPKRAYAADMKRYRLLAVVGILLAATGCHPGMMLLKLSVSRAGETLAEVLFEVSDSSDVEAMWAAAGQRPVSGELFLNALAHEEVSPAEQPLEARIRGPVVLSVTHGGHLWSEVTLDGVRLERSADRSVDWRLSAADVARAQRAASR